MTSPNKRVTWAFYQLGALAIELFGVLVREVLKKEFAPERKYHTAQGTTLSSKAYWLESSVVC